MNAIEIKGLTKKYKDTLAVDGLDLSAITHITIDETLYIGSVK